MRKPTLLETLEDLENTRNAIYRILKEQDKGNLIELRKALVELKNNIRRKNIPVEDLYGDFDGEGE